MTYQLPALPQPDNTDIMEKSSETIEWLRGGNILVGYTSDRGPAWWANGVVTKNGLWEGLPDGTHFDGPVPIERVLELLNVPLVKGEITVRYKGEDGKRRTVQAPQFAPVVNARSGEVFSVPSKSYAIHPYRESLHDLISAIEYDEHVAVSSVGLLKKGAVAFLQARLPETFEVCGYGYQPYLMGVTSANRTRSTFYCTGCLGAVCDNTVDAAALGAATSVKVRHTKNSFPKVQIIRDQLGLRLVSAADEIGQMIEELANVTVTDREFGKWLDLEVPIPEKALDSATGGKSYTTAVRKRERYTDLWTSDPKVTPWKGTKFGVLQLVNTDRTWNGNVRIRRNFSDTVFGLGARSDTASMKNLAQVLAA